MKVSFAPLLLQFKFDAGTSRGVLKTKKTWIVKLEIDGKIGYGEIAPLKGLSSEGYEDFEPVLLKELKRFKVESQINDPLIYSSSTLFGLETALLALKNQNFFKVFDNGFYEGKTQLPINGLVWMGDVEFMKAQINEKLANGFSCIKMKIGAIDFNEEYQLLKQLRADYPKEQLTLRVDANGAFTFKQAKEVLNKLDELGIHSIEQPIKAGQLAKMYELCNSGVATGIALDEELIGVRKISDKKRLLDTIKPQYIILKPTLHGGISGTKEWIDLAEEREIAWWMTSALESNIGLNAVCQLTASYDIKMPQGLGTGSLYHNNIASPLEVKGEFIFYNKGQQWDLSTLKFVEI